METLFGVGFGSLPVLARAAVLLEAEDGRLTLDDELLNGAMQRVKRGEEAQDIVLVAPEATNALLLRLPRGLTLAAIVAEEPLPARPLSTNIPVVADILEVRAQISEGAWLLVDAANDRVVVEPDAETVARYQQTQLYRRPRLSVGGEAGVPTQTQEGATVAVWAVVTSSEEANDAFAQGADGIVLEMTADTKPATLRRFAATTGGHLLAVADTMQQIALDDAVTLAATCTFCWMLPDFADAAGLREQAQTMVRQARRANQTADAPRLCAIVAPTMGDIAAREQQEEALRRFDEILLVGDAPLENLVFLPPLRVWLADADSPDLPARLELAVAALGARGVVVALAQIGLAKRLIREIA